MTLPLQVSNRPFSGRRISLQIQREVASGSLGSADVMLLPEGDYRVQLHSSPSVEAQVRLATLPLDRARLRAGGSVPP